MALPLHQHALQAHNEELGDSQLDDCVTMPDMFVSFLARKPQINPHYDRVKGESEAWIAELCGYSQKNYQKHIKADFSYFVSIWAREAEPEELRTICDWMNWTIDHHQVFDFDDMFDEGCFKDDKEEAARRVASLMRVMESENNDQAISSSAGDSLLMVFELVWRRVAERRFIQSMVDYMNGVVGQVDTVCSGEQLSEQRFLAMRRQSIGAGPCFALIEYFYHLDLPDEAGDVDQNLIALYGRQGIPPQEAYDRIDILLKERYREWYLAQAELPQWGEVIDEQLQKYIRAMQDVITANMYWSFHTTRYFGKDTDSVRETRVITIPPDQLIKNGLTTPRGRRSIDSNREAGSGSSDGDNDIAWVDADMMTDVSSSPRDSETK
ncbi:MAG: hypothetical protein L6R41_001600 [Letrouitia leprolyta]|nr:MAG: hypothetical protein L6R41_001600 [Letrouitia leprolyta]